MIHWLVQSTSDNPDLARGIAPAGLLNIREQDQFATLVAEKRRRDWLLGRWTSKILLQSVVRQQTGIFLPLEHLSVNNSASGAPYATWEAQYGDLPITLSISHSGDRALCAAFGLISWNGPDEPVSPGLPSIPVAVLGADIEQIESRSPGFMQDYFTETEIALIDHAPLPTRDLLVTATWSAKESALKAVHLGLSVDTRSVTCLIEPVTDPPQDWRPFDIQWDVRRLNRCFSNESSTPNPLCPQRSRVAGEGVPVLGGWWRIMDGYVLTLAAGKLWPGHQNPVPLEGV